MEVSDLLHALVTVASRTHWIRSWVGFTGQRECLWDQEKLVSPVRNSNLICSAPNTTHAMLAQLLPNNFTQKCWYAFLIFPIPAQSNLYSFTDFLILTILRNRLSHNAPCLLTAQIPHLLQVFWSVFLSISCSFQIPTLCNYLGVRNHVSHPYQTKGKIILC